MIAAAGGAPPDRLPTDDYFAEYAQLYDHIGMLQVPCRPEARPQARPRPSVPARATPAQDTERMDAYYNAIKYNAAVHFKGKTVLDVGSGTGVLAIWAAMAGARRVYAVEASSIGTHIETLVESHGLSDVVTVVRDRMEKVRTQAVRACMPTRRRSAARTHGPAHASRRPRQLRRPAAATEPPYRLPTASLTAALRRYTSTPPSCLLQRYPIAVPPPV